MKNSLSKLTYQIVIYEKTCHQNTICHFTSCLIQNIFSAYFLWTYGIRGKYEVRLFSIRNNLICYIDYSEGMVFPYMTTMLACWGCSSARARRVCVCLCVCECLYRYHCLRNSWCCAVRQKHDRMSSRVTDNKSCAQFVQSKPSIKKRSHFYRV